MNFMDYAVKEAKKAYNEGNVPVGCVFVYKNKIVAKTHNKKNVDKVAIFHAEILGIIEASRALSSWRLDECDVYVTLEPCSMCLNALAEARVKNVYYLLNSNYYNNLIGNLNNIKLKKLPNSSDYKTIITDFFKNMRLK